MTNFTFITILNYYPDSRGRKLAGGKSKTLGLVLRQSDEQVFAEALLSQVLLDREQAVDVNHACQYIDIEEIA